VLGVARWLVVVEIGLISSKAWYSLRAVVGLGGS